MKSTSINVCAHTHSVTDEKHQVLRGFDVLLGEGHDGVVSYFEESAITNENRPVTKRTNSGHSSVVGKLDDVLSGVVAVKWDPLCQRHCVASHSRNFFLKRIWN